MVATIDRPAGHGKFKIMFQQWHLTSLCTECVYSASTAHVQTQEVMNSYAITQPFRQSLCHMVFRDHFDVNVVL